jgi:hypothetical protein
MKKGFILNPQTNRVISTSTAQYRKLVKLGVIIEETEPQEVEKVEKVEKLKPQKEKVEKVEKVEKLKPQKEKVEKVEEYDEAKLQNTLADLSTDLIKENMKAIVKAQKLSDDELSILLKKMLFSKLCGDGTENPSKAAPKKTKKSKFKITHKQTSSDEESESD